MIHTAQPPEPARTPVGDRRTTRRGPATRPAGRHDSRRPAHRRPTSTALRQAAQRERESRSPHRWFASQLLTVLSGLRPTHSLLGHIRGIAYEQLCRLAPYQPLLTSAVRPPLPVLAGLGRTQPRDGVIEAFARIAAGERQLAMAFRLELCPDRRWRCSALELDGARP
ncbi:Rv3235 family protein [Streptomyces sp. NPDC005438]|uniref:Rv3235 family protein n=1 Tax=Streptomyces sp. NPDC005438 TaxID=3156880 RepID=UPI0033B64318